MNKAQPSSPGAAVKTSRLRGRCPRADKAWRRSAALNSCQGLWGRWTAQVRRSPVGPQSGQPTEEPTRQRPQRIPQTDQDPTNGPREPCPINQTLPNELRQQRLDLTPDPLTKTATHRPHPTHRSFTTLAQGASRRRWTRRLPNGPHLFQGQVSVGHQILRHDGVTDLAPRTDSTADPRKLTADVALIPTMTCQTLTTARQRTPQLGKTTPLHTDSLRVILEADALEE